ncbi:MAG: MFS transporter [Caldisericia bacterium]|nr:MFS transporter [Caldisericia bacterium]
MFNVILTGLTSFLTDISTEMFYPLISLYIVALGGGPEIIGLIEGIAESLASLLKVFSGNISDMIKKRKILAIFGYSFSVIGKIFMYFASGWGGVFTGRVIDRIGKGIRTAPRDALIAESVNEKRGRAFGIHRTMDTLGAFLGVLISLYLINRFELLSIETNKNTISNYLPIFKYIILISIIPGVLGVLFLFFVKETATGLPLGKKIILNLKIIPKKLRGFLLVTLIFTFGNSSNQFLLLKAKNIGFSIISVLTLYLVYNLTYALFSYPLGRLSDRIGRKWIIVLGYLIYGIVYISYAFAKTSLSLYTLFAIYGLYMAFTEGVEKALISDLSPPEFKGSLIGLHATLVGIGLFPASLIGGLLWQYISPQATFIFGGIMGIFASVGMILVI